MTVQTGRITCLLLEDEKSSREMIYEVLQTSHPNIDLLVATNLREADELMENHELDMLIMDINLPDGNSLTWLVSRFDKQKHLFRIIFTTAYSDYAIEAFRFNAMDFLLKPFAPSELITAVNKVSDQIQQDHQKIELEIALQNMTNQNPKERKIVLRTIEDIHVVDLQDILYASADNNYTHFKLLDGRTLLLSQPLKTFEKKLEGSQFLRIHQTFLVNTTHIITYRKKTGHVILSDQTEIPVAQSKKAQLLDFFAKLS